MTQETEPKHINLSTLRSLMADRFGLNDLEILCFDLSIDYEDISGNIKKTKIKNLIKSLEDQGRLPELVEQLKIQREHVDWDAIYEDGPIIEFKYQSKRWLLVILSLVAIVLVIGLFGVVRSGVMCAYHEPSDYATIERIIKAESQAVNEGNLEIIEDIFAPNATIQQTESVDGTTNIKEWFDPISHYSPLFANTKFSGAQHTDIEGSVTGNYAKFTSGSKGSYVTGDYHGEYDNEAGNPDEEEVWTLAKNFWGCWQITRFEFH